VVRLPDGVEGGDLLQLQTSAGVMMVPVPENAPLGCNLEVIKTTALFEEDLILQ
jgi:hypothetical protein